MRKICIACGAIPKLYIKSSNYFIYKCSKCGLGNTENLKPQAGDYHRDDTYIKEQKIFENIFKRRISQVIGQKKSSGRVLEIGSSTGLLLLIFKKRGWEVLGIEPSLPAAKFAVSKGIPTKTGCFEKIDLPNNYFDAVVINHTLEHLEDPLLIVRKINRILKPGGVLLIDVPNFGSLSLKILKEHWPSLLPSEHIWHFTYESLDKILIKSGFGVLKATMPSGVWDFNNPYLELLQSFLGLKKRFVPEILFLIPNLLVTKLKMGTSLTILSEKTK